MSLHLKFISKFKRKFNKINKNLNLKPAVFINKLLSKLKLLFAGRVKTMDLKREKKGSERRLSLKSEHWIYTTEEDIPHKTWVQNSVAMALNSLLYSLKAFFEQQIKQDKKNTKLLERMSAGICVEEDRNGSVLTVAKMAMRCCQNIAGNPEKESTPSGLTRAHQSWQSHVSHSLSLLFSLLIAFIKF